VRDGLPPPTRRVASEMVIDTMVKVMSREPLSAASIGVMPAST